MKVRILNSGAYSSALEHVTSIYEVLGSIFGIKESLKRVGELLEPRVPAHLAPQVWGGTTLVKILGSHLQTITPTGSDVRHIALCLAQKDVVSPRS